MTSCGKQGRQQIPSWYPPKEILRYKYDWPLQCKHKSRYRGKLDDGSLFLRDKCSSEDAPSWLIDMFKFHRIGNPILSWFMSHFSSRKQVPQETGYTSHLWSLFSSWLRKVCKAPRSPLCALMMSSVWLGTTSFGWSNKRFHILAWSSRISLKWPKS